MAPKHKVWYTGRGLDYKRYRRELDDFLLTYPQYWPLLHTMFEGDDTARLILADAAEEEGRHYLSMFLRRSLVCGRKPSIWWKKRRQRGT